MRGYDTPRTDPDRNPSPGASGATLSHWERVGVPVSHSSRKSHVRQPFSAAENCYCRRRPGGADGCGGSGARWCGGVRSSTRWHRPGANSCSPDAAASISRIRKILSASSRAMARRRRFCARPLKAFLRKACAYGAPVLAKKPSSAPAGACFLPPSKPRRCCAPGCKRLDALGVRLLPRHRWLGWDEDGGLLFATPAGRL